MFLCNHISVSVFVLMSWCFCVLMCLYMCRMGRVLKCLLMIAPLVVMVFWCLFVSVFVSLYFVVVWVVVARVCFCLFLCVCACISVCLFVCICLFPCVCVLLMTCVIVYTSYLFMCLYLFMNVCLSNYFYSIPICDWYSLFLCLGLYVILCFCVCLCLCVFLLRYALILLSCLHENICIHTYLPAFVYCLTSDLVFFVLINCCLIMYTFLYLRAWVTMYAYIYIYIFINATMIVNLLDSS